MVLLNIKRSQEREHKLTSRYQCTHSLATQASTAWHCGADRAQCRATPFPRTSRVTQCLILATRPHSIASVRHNFPPLPSAHHRGRAGPRHRCSSQRPQAEHDSRHSSVIVPGQTLGPIICLDCAGLAWEHLHSFLPPCWPSRQRTCCSSCRRVWSNHFPVPSLRGGSSIRVTRMPHCGLLPRASRNHRHRSPVIPLLAPSGRAMEVRRYWTSL